MSNTSDWNPNFSSFAENNQSILNYEDEMTVPEQQKLNPMLLPDSDDENDGYGISDVSVKAWEQA
eukprot:3266707-Ditylum_brightwellii.AAC.1